MVIIAVLPLLACFGYYTAERLNNPTSLQIFAAVLAAPLTLIGLASTLTQLLRRPRRTRLIFTSLAVFLAPTLFLLVVWLFG